MLHHVMSGVQSLEVVVLHFIIRLFKYKIIIILINLQE